MTLVYLWIGLSVLGLVLTASNLREAIKDRRAARARPDYHQQSSIALMATAGVRRTAVNVIVMATFLAVGLSVLWTPRSGLTMWVFTGGLCGANVLLVTDAVGRRQSRAAVRRAALRERVADLARRSKRRQGDDAG
jgi:hypothetical protein